MGLTGVCAFPATTSVGIPAAPPARMRAAIASSHRDQLQPASTIPSNKVSSSGPAAACSARTARCPAVIRPSPGQSIG